MTTLEEDSGIKNYTVSVYEDEKDIIFLHKIVPGSASKSYGIHVAKKAGIPTQITQLANEVLMDLETNESAQVESKRYDFKETAEPALPDWVTDLKALNIEEMTMREMANALMDYVEKAQQV